MVCSKCHADNPADKKFCGECGARREAPAPVPIAGAEPGTYACHRHPKQATRIRCGHCGAPVCPRCAVYGPVGVRCRQCASHRVGVRPRAVLHEAGKAFEGSTRGAGRTVWYLAVWYFIISLFTGPRDT